MENLYWILGLTRVNVSLHGWSEGAHFFTFRYGTVSQVATFIYEGLDEMIPYDNKLAYFLPTLLMFWEFQIERLSRRVIDVSNFGYLEDT